MVPLTNLWIRWLNHLNDDWAIWRELRSRPRMKARTYEFRVKQLGDKVPDDSLIARQLFTLSRHSPHKIRKTLSSSSSSSYVEITQRRNALCVDILSCTRALSSVESERERERERERAREKEDYSCLSEEGLSLSISRHRGGGLAGSGRMRTVRGHVVLLFIPNPWAYRIGGRSRTRLLASLVRARCRAIYQKASESCERREEEPYHVRRRASVSPALGDCHFCSFGPAR